MAKRRVPLQVSPRFREKLKDLQFKIMKMGKNKSLRDLTEDIVNSVDFAQFEKRVLDGDNINLNMSIRFDRRLL